MEKLLKKHEQKIRYGIVGIANTAFDFILLFAFVALGVDKIVANFFSTGIAMVVSFFANKQFTFKNNGKQKRQFVLFIAVTVFGMWVIQPIIIWGVTHSLNPYMNNPAAELFIAKTLATGASLIWNYYMYSRLVFKKHQNQVS